VSKFQKIEHAVQDLQSIKRSHTFLGALGLAAICALILWLEHGAWLRSPNEHLLGGGPDGFKNYMTTAWHIRHDTDYVHYGGMNYPFGEHVLFTDNQPIFSAVLQWWSNNVSDLAGRTAGILNVSLLLSMLFGCVILFLLFRKLHLPVWYAGPAALGVTFLSPQYNRIDGHFGLSHQFVIPLILYLLCVYEEQYSRRYQALLIGIVVWISAQLHFYYLGMAALFLTLYTGYQTVRDFSFRTMLLRFAHWSIMILLPFAALNFWVHWSDFAADRPANPYGFTVYIGYWEGVFLPYESFPLYQWIDKNIIPIRRINGEAIAYAGMVVTLFTLWLLFSGFKMFGKDWKEAAYHRVHRHYLRGIFIAALLLLLFACGFPFAIPGLEWLVDYMGPLRQFRGLGRFTWVYYYVVSILAFYCIWNWSLRFNGIRGGRFVWLRWVLALAPPALLGYEAILWQTKKKIDRIPNIEKRELAAPAPDHWLNKVDFGPYQALLPLPYYHLGSENIWLDFDYAHFKNVQTTALHTGVPDMGVNMSRTSARQTTESVQFILEPCELPTMLNELSDERPLALLVHGPKWEEVRRNYRHLVEKAKMVYEHPDMKILSLRPDSIRTYVREHLDEIRADMAAQTLYPVADWSSTRNTKDFYYQSYDSLHKTHRIFQGNGAFQGNMKDTTWIWNNYLPKGFHYINCWIYVNQDLGMNHDMKIIENRRDNGMEIHFKHEGLRFHLKTIVNGWGLFEFPFEVYHTDSNVRIFLQKPNADQEFFLDEVLIKPADISLYRREPGWLVRNNFWYRE
jgi:hypothetical protein